jgi:hypothetical protein
MRLLLLVKGDGLIALITMTLVADDYNGLLCIPGHGSDLDSKKIGRNTVTSNACFLLRSRDMTRAEWLKCWREL